MSGPELPARPGLPLLVQRAPWPSCACCQDKSWTQVLVLEVLGRQHFQRLDGPSPRGQFPSSTQGFQPHINHYAF